MSDFKLFRPLDTVSFVGINSIPTAALVYACSHGLAANPQALALMIVVTACFWGIYVAFLIARRAFLKRITFITKHNIAVIANGFDVKQSDVEAKTDDVIARWNKACNWTKSAECLDGMWIEFRQFPVVVHSVIGPLAGFLIGNNAVIGYRVDLDQTAMTHEEGHAIHEVFYGKPDNDACHKFMADHNLP